MEIENIVANTVLLKAREGKIQQWRNQLSINESRINFIMDGTESSVLLDLTTFATSVQPTFLNECSLLNSISFNMLVRTSYAQSPLSDP